MKQRPVATKAIHEVLRHPVKDLHMQEEITDRKCGIVNYGASRKRVKKRHK